MKKAALGLFVITLVLVCSCKKDSVLKEKNCECSQTGSSLTSTMIIQEGNCSDYNSSSTVGSTTIKVTCVEQ